jgi:hypothetical protein
LSPFPTLKALLKVDTLHCRKDNVIKTHFKKGKSKNQSNHLNHKNHSSDNFGILKKLSPFPTLKALLKVDTLHCRKDNVIKTHFKKGKSKNQSNHLNHKNHSSDNFGILKKLSPFPTLKALLKVDTLVCGKNLQILNYSWPTKEVG